MRWEDEIRIMGIALLTPATEYKFYNRGEQEP
jgi:hypothetical protein